MAKSARKSIVVIFLASFLGLSLLVALLSSATGLARAVAPLYVDDNSCPAVGSGTTVDPFCNIQSAVDAAADKGEIRVAGGTYTGTQRVTALNSLVYTQVVLIDRKSLTVTGAYDRNDWTAEPDPGINPTIIDAQRSGRGITVIGLGDEIVTLEGMTVTGGDYANQGNPPGQGGRGCLGTGYDCGGGLKAQKVRLIMRDMIVFDNIAGHIGQDKSTQGGGLEAYELQPGSMIERSQFISNTAGGPLGTGGYGGGINLAYSELTIKDTLFEGNYAARGGGGLDLLIDNAVTIYNTDFKDNYAFSTGGAIFASQGYCQLGAETMVLEGGYLTGNEAYDGSAIFISHPRGRTGECGASLTNLILAGNRSTGSSTSQSVLYVGNYDNAYKLELNHVTSADNESPTFLYLESGSMSTIFTATVNNTLVATSTVGITGEVTTGTMSVDINNPLFSNVLEETHVQSGDPGFNISNKTTGDPRFDNTYHLKWGSAAINGGFNAGVLIDIDGDQRADPFPDIGADEKNGAIYLPITIK